MAVEPKLLLLDEPFGALDAKVRKELRPWLRRLHDELRVTSILVTHDQEEALEAADRAVVMHRHEERGQRRQRAEGGAVGKILFELWEERGQCVIRRLEMLRDEFGIASMSGTP